MSYEDARRRADGIAEVVAERRMPPWHADPRHGEFANDRRLTSRERATLLAWVDQGTPRGDAAKEPAAKAWPEGWSIGTPDAVIEMPEEYVVQPEGDVAYQRFVVKTGFEEDVWVRAIEPQPGNRAVVHHIIVYMKTPGRRSSGPNGMEHLAAYAPGDLPTVLPEGVAKRIPKGADLVFEMHYTPNGKVAIDRSRVGFVFAKERPRFRALTMPIVNDDFRIPPGAPAHEVERTIPLPRETTIMGFLPHMHLRGKDFTYTAIYPDGREEVLLAVPRYDFAWQSYYWLKEPKVLPAGTKVRCVAHFDNSASNPALTPEDVATEVTWGDQTYEEMMIGYVDVLLPVGPARAE
jgi:hypothetical protein